jgi:hypothetical protein
MNTIHKIHHELIIAISLSFLSIECSRALYGPTRGILRCLQPLRIAYAIRCGLLRESVSRLNLAYTQALPTSRLALDENSQSI